MPTPGPTTEEIWHALEESVKLQSHYATLLNQLDGGERVTFAGPDAWIQRLRRVKDAEVHAASVRAFNARQKP